MYNVKRISKENVIKQIEKFGSWEGWIATSKVHPNDEKIEFKPCLNHKFFKKDLLPNEDGSCSKFEYVLGRYWFHYNDKNGHRTVFYELK